MEICEHVVSTLASRAVSECTMPRSTKNRIRLYREPSPTSTESTLVATTVLHPRPGRCACVRDATRRTPHYFARRLGRDPLNPQGIDTARKPKRVRAHMAHHTLSPLPRRASVVRKAAPHKLRRALPRGAPLISQHAFPPLAQTAEPWRGQVWECGSSQLMHTSIAHVYSTRLAHDTHTSHTM